MNSFSFWLLGIIELWHNPRWGCETIILEQLWFIWLQCCGWLSCEWSEVVFLAALFRSSSWLLSLWRILAIELDFWISSMVEKLFRAVKCCIHFGQQLDLGLESCSGTAVSDFIKVTVILLGPSGCSLIFSASIGIDSHWFIWPLYEVSHIHACSFEFPVLIIIHLSNYCGDESKSANRDLTLSSVIEATVLGRLLLSGPVPGLDDCSIWWEDSLYVKLC